jgi:capsular polysaccharide transport system permease protein
MLLAGGVMTVWSLMKPPILHGMPLLIFILTGYLPLTLWRHLTSRGVRILSGSSALLYHCPISVGKIIVSWLVLEGLSSTTALLVIYLIILATGLDDANAGAIVIFQPSVIIAAWLLIAWLSSAVGLLLAAWAEFWEPAERIIPPLQYLFLPICGCFYMVDWLPDKAQHILLLVPTVNGYEMFRDGFFGAGVTTHYDPWYLMAWAFALTIIGLAAIHHVRNRIQIS